MSLSSGATSERREAATPGASAVLLACFPGAKNAAQDRRAVERRLRRDGNHVLETTVVEVNSAGKVSVRDPRRVLVGALTSALTWGVFGLVSGGWPSLVFSALLGAVWGGWAARSHAHHPTGVQLARAAARLPPDSSSLLVFAGATNAESVLAAGEAANATVSSVALIAGDLSATILHAGGVGESAGSDPDSLRMVLVRYDDVAAAKEVASRMTAGGKADASLDVELVIEIDRSGRTRVSDPKLGAAAVARYNARSWSVLGLICGALAGLTGGHGFIGFLEGGLVTAVAWGLFGAGAGALYGLWVGRAISARRLRPIAPLLHENSSMLFAWTDAPPGDQTPFLFATGAEQERLTLSFAATDRGPVLALG
jgi:hypothetical protein